MSKRAVFILTHNRGKKQPTLEYLMQCDVWKSGEYDWFLVLSKDDQKLSEAPNTVSHLVFNKEDVLPLCDLYTTSNNPKAMKSPIAARRFIIDYALENGYDYWCLFDDDYKYWENALVIKTRVKEFRLKRYWDSMFQMSDSFNVAFMQNGERRRCNNDLVKLSKFKTMNTFFMSRSHCAYFNSITEDDTCRFVLGNKIGDLHLQFTMLSIQQEAAHRKKKGVGMNEAYKGDFYLSRFCSVMADPANVTIRYSQVVNRLHHHIENNFPKILE